MFTRAFPPGTEEEQSNDNIEAGTQAGQDPGGVGVIPVTRREALDLLDGVGWDPRRLTPSQADAIEDLYHLHDYRRVSEREAVTIETVGTEVETAPIEVDGVTASTGIPLPRKCRVIGNGLSKRSKR